MTEGFADDQVTTRERNEVGMKPRLRCTVTPAQLGLDAAVPQHWIAVERSSAAGCLAACGTDVMATFYRRYRRYMFWQYHAGEYASEPGYAEEEAAQCELLRCVLGNPFRPAAPVDPAWLTSTVTALARQMYESRDFALMPILADAIQDAGCEQDDVLDHCRADASHARGCWVVDLVLGKT